ncbi:MAG: hypothetical protein ACR2O8_13320 [Rhizobiaceae bacterium]
MKILIYVLTMLLLTGCVHHVLDSNPYHPFSASYEEIQSAKAQGLPYFKNANGHYQLLEPLVFHTKQFGRVKLLPQFVSDGSSRPLDKDEGSNRAAFLHDALYRGPAQLIFLDGYPGRWTRAEADAAYCLQLQRQGAKELTAKTNCRAVRFLRVGQGNWMFHEETRTAYWERNESGSAL